MNAATLNRPGSAGLIAGLAGLLVTGGFALSQLGSSGHAAFNATSLGLMWGLPIVTYDFFLMTSAGLTLVASLGTVAGLKDFEPSARRCLWLAFAMMAGGVAALFLELGSPLKALYAIPLGMQFKAPLFWKVLAIGVYVVALLLIATGWLQRAEGESPAPAGASMAAALASICIVFTGSMMYATLSMRPLWYSGEMPVLFLVEALLGGLALAMLTGPVGGAVPRLASALLGVLLLLVLGRVVVGLGSNLDGMQVWHAIVASPLFWFEVLAGFLVPMVLLAKGAAGGTRTIASVLVLAGLFIAKYEFVIGGQLVPLFKGSWARGLIDYAPSPAEWSLLGLSAFLALAIYAIGSSRLRLGAR